jgi:single-strand DNA-binding protein
MSTKSLNKVMLIGHLGKDPELKYTPSGVPVASFSIATNRSWKDESGNPVEKTDWHNIVAWRKLGEICSEHLKKGSKVYVEGRLETRNYDDKEGKKVYVTEININDMIMLDSKGSSQPRPVQNAEPVHTENTATTGTTETSTDVDDLPF